MKMHGNLNMGPKVTTEGLLGRLVLCSFGDYDPTIAKVVIAVDPDTDSVQLEVDGAWIHTKYLRYA